MLMALMAETTKPQVGPRILLTLALLIIVIGGLQLAEVVVVPFLLSVFLSILGMPPYNWLRKHGWPSALALLVVLLGFGGLIVGLGIVVVGSATAFSQALPEYDEGIVVLLEDVESSLASIEILRNLGVNFEFSSIVADVIDPARILQFSGALLLTVTNFLSSFVIVFLMMIFILTEASGFPAKVRSAFGEGSGKLLQFSSVMTQVHRYLIIKTIVSLATGLVLGTWVWVLGVDFPILWGVLAFLLNYIPNIGSILAAVPPLTVALIQPQGGGVTLCLLVIAGFAVANIVIGNFVEPSLMGKRLGLSTLVVFLSLVFWGWVWGGVGMLLSVPLTMVVKILLENTDEYRWIAVLLDKSPKAPRLAG